MKNIVIERLHATPVSEQKVEIVERKGRGHPDFICDAMMNQVSVELSKEYLKRFGAIMHHNIDKSLLVAGEAQQAFGGGKILKPMLMVIGDRATFEVNGEEVPVNEITLRTCKDWIKNNLRFLDPEKDIKFQIELKRGSAALQDIFKRGGKILGANDTSAAVGYAPLTETERLVLETEQYLNSKDFKRRYPESGEDIKVMAVRTGREIVLTVAMAFVDRFVKNEDDYFKKKDEILEEIKNFVNAHTTMKHQIYLNTLDMRGRGLGGVYLTVTGTSAEDADCGEVGRGNRVNGIIPLNRPIGSEAAAGKNPVSHIGKIYNVLTHHIAGEIHRAVPGIKEVYVWLVSQIGVPIDNPKIAAAQIIMEKGTIEDIKKEVDEVMNRELDNLPDFIMKLAHGKIPVC
jgi:S-adenosylmethionine synthetase